MSKKPTKSDLARIDAMKDEDIDYSDIPELTPEFFARAKLVMPEGKERVTMRLDRAVLGWLRKDGEGYQTRINAILRMAMQSQMALGKTRRTR